MQKRTVFLLLETKEANQALAQKFIDDQDFEVVGFSSDGISAISMIADKRPKVLITELVLVKLTIANMKSINGIMSVFSNFRLFSYNHNPIPIIKTPIIAQASGVGFSKIGFPSMTVWELEMKLMKFTT